MSDITRTPPDLLSMPNEILTEICTYACDEGYNMYGRKRSSGREWLCAVRLTCKQLYTPASLEFGKRFLEDPFVMITDYSLEALNDICAHPLFGPRVRGISFDEFRSDEWYAESIYRKTTKSVLARDVRKMKTAGDRLQRYSKSYSEQYELGDSGRGEDLIVKALKLIKQHNKPVSIALLARIFEMPIGSRRRDNGNEYQMKTTFRMLVSAAQRSQYRINKFLCQIPPQSYDRPIQDNNPEIDIAEIARGSGIFAGLECMRFEVYSYEHTLTSALCGVLGTAAMISDFELSTCVQGFATWWATESYETTQAILRSVCCGSLKRPGALKKFLLKHRHTLREVFFDVVTLVGAWDEILRWIRDTLNLQILSVSELRYMDVSEFEEDDAEEKVAYSWFDGVRWSDPENICLGIDQLLEKKKKGRRRQ
ncbi:hypothetical protein E4T50_09772 [Aureobasidium sp. EXF-12298]|nr:hypothetical protein E4T50_09772 [Aureobasidium sp. EXF-12298]KAI4757381.1 hypothetical protein E4T51_09546 [Aureobasidium sp. EXF-12344]KAI4777547.1 hypothetical protein E4T52_07527 [Aureobasidium sp. EXF-3400]